MSLAPFYLAGYAVAIATSLVVAVYAGRKRPEPGATSFAGMLLLVAAWASAATVGLVTVDPDLRLFWETVQMTTALLTPVAWFVFVLAYTGYGSALTKRRAGALFAVPVVATGLLWVDPTPLIWTDYTFVRAQGLWLVDQHTGPLLWAGNFYAAMLVLGGTGLLLQFSFTAGHLYRDQTVAIGIGAAVPIAVSFLSAMDVTPVQGLNVTPLGFVVSGAAFGNAFSRYDFFEHVPAAHRLGRRAITENMRDGVVIVDDRDRIVEGNDVAATVLGTDPTTMVEARLGDAFPESVWDGTRADGELSVDSDEGRRVYDVRSSPIVDQHERRVGRVIVFRDVTERKNREQRLSVLNRVLRHNLRNDMNLVDGYAGELAERLDGEPAERAGTIQAVATELIELSEKARDVEAVLAETATDVSREDCEALIETIVDDVENRYPAATVETDLEAGIRVPGTRSRAIVENLVENAVEHNDAAHPRVEIGLELVDGGSTCLLIVEDDGPGLPAGEQAVLEKETETPLEHGSGLGLWIVAWAVRSLGGDVTFDTSMDGTEVRVRIPVSDGGPETGGS